MQTLETRRWTLFRQSAHRRLWADEASSLFVKEFLPRRWLGSGLQTSRGRREWEILNRLWERGIAVPEPLGFEEEENGASRLLLRLLPGSPLDRRRPWAPGSPPSPEWIPSFARLVRELHDLGLRDPDRHGGNFLLGRDGRIWAVDFHKARIGSPLTLRERRRALGVLWASLLAALSPQERLLFLDRYDASGARPSWKPREVALEVEASARKLRARRLARKSRQALREGTRFEKANLAGFEGFLRKGTSLDRVRETLRTLATLPAPQILKRGSRTLVLSCPGDPAWVAKVYWKRSLPSKLRCRLGWGRARRAWRRAFHLELGGGRGALTVALLEGPEADLLISEEVGSGVDFARYLAEVAAPKEREPAWVEAGALVAGIHLAGLGAWDLRPENLLLRAEEGRPVLYLIDFDGLGPLPSVARRPGDLGRILASFPRIPEPEFRAFLESYLVRTGPRPSPQALESFRLAVCRAAQAVRRRWQRQGKAPGGPPA